ncbi:MAG: SNF2-related protein [Candidatus Cloacimonas acidaminovorans]|nr:SNF2-related protein [Candidatus Cloacimonas acidaminovorans]
MAQDFNTWKKNRGTSISPNNDSTGIADFDEWRKKRKQVGEEKERQAKVGQNLAMQANLRMMRATGYFDKPKQPVIPVDEIQHESNKKSAIKSAGLSLLSSVSRGVSLIGGSVESIGRTNKNEGFLGGETSIFSIKKDTIGDKVFRKVGAGMEKGGKYVKENFDFADEMIRGNSGYVEEYASFRDESGKFDINKLKDPKVLLNVGASGVGSMAPIIAAGALGGGAPAFATAFLTEKGDAVSEYSEKLAKERGVRVEDLSNQDIAKIDISSTGYGAVSSALETILPLKFVNKLGIGGSKEVVKKVWQRVPVEIAKSIITEGGTEGLQKFTQNVISKLAITDKQDLAEGVIDEAIAGALVGGGIAALGEVADTNINPPQKQVIKEDKEEKKAKIKTQEETKAKEMIKALADNDVEKIERLSGELTSKELREVDKVLEFIEQKEQKKDENFSLEDRKILQEKISDKENGVKETVGEAILSDENKMSDLDTGARKEAVDLFKRVAETDTEHAEKAKEIIKKIDETNKKIDGVLSEVKEQKQELLKEKAEAETRELKKSIQTKIDTFDDVKRELLSKVNLPDLKPREISDIQEKLSEVMDDYDGKQRQEIVDKQNELLDKDNAYIKKNKEILYDKDGINLDVVKYDDGTWKVHTGATGKTEGFGHPYFGNFKSKDEAIKYGLKRISDFLDKIEKEGDKSAKKQKANLIKQFKQYEKDISTGSGDNGKGVSGANKVGTSKQAGTRENAKKYESGNKGQSGNNNDKSRVGSKDGQQLKDGSEIIYKGEKHRVLNSWYTQESDKTFARLFNPNTGKSIVIEEDEIFSQKNKTQKEIVVEAETLSKEDLDNLRLDVGDALIEAGELGIKIKELRQYGSTERGEQKDSSDYDIYIEYEGDIREDDFFNLLADHFKDIKVNGRNVDFNPVKAEKTGTIKEAIDKDPKENKLIKMSPIGGVIMDILIANGQTLDNEDLYIKIERRGFEKLVIQKISKNEISIAHYYEQNGDLMIDPEAIFEIVDGRLVAKTIQHNFNLPVMPIKDNDPFFKLWAENLKSQGFASGFSDISKEHRAIVNKENLTEVDIVTKGDKYYLIYKDRGDGKMDIYDKEFLTFDEALKAAKIHNKSRLGLNSNISNVEKRVKKYSKAEIEKLVNSKKEFTEAEKEALRQYEGSGGQKEGSGRGVLDEFYTPKKIVDKMWSLTIKNLSDNIDKKNLNILEPSVGTGRFLERAPKGSNITAFETNPISAKITKVLYPNARVNNTSFETLFIDEKGKKKAFDPKYQIVIGNPPYGIHRGKYKGLGEEKGIGRYEEYFIKRGLDLTVEGGVLSMIVPSGFLRGGFDKIKGMIALRGDLVDAYRLPNKSFDNTEIGTDILIFKKHDYLSTGEQVNGDILANDEWFKQNPEKVLGVETEKKGKFGMEKYIEGNIDEGLSIIQDAELAEEEFDENIEKMEQEEVEITKKERKTAIKENTKAKRTKSKASFDNGLYKITDGYKIESTKQSKTKTFSQGNIEEIESFKNVREDGSLYDFTGSKFDVGIEDLFYHEGKVYNRYNYLQGDIVQKLEDLKHDKDRLTDKAYKKQKEELEKIMPKQMTIDKISFLPISKMADEIKIDKYGEERTLKNAFINWMETLPYQAREGVSGWEIENYVNGLPVRGGDKETNKEIRKKRRIVGNKLFRKFYREELTEDQQKLIEDRFNKSFNSYVKPDYSKYPLEIELHNKFYKKDFQLRDIQMEGAAFLVNKGVGLLAYEVGVGKTLSGIAALQGVMKKGWTKKPLIIVPKNLKSKWINDLVEAMPGVKINDLANLGGNFKFKGDINELEIENGSISIITEDGFKRIGFSEETYNRLTKDLEDTLYDNKEQKSKRQKEIEASKAEEREGKAKRGTDFPLTFEELGFDHIMIDEAHRAKNVFSSAKATKDKKSNEYSNLRGSVSDRGLKTYLATQYILEKNNGRNVFLLTATPFNNSPIEIYSMMSLMAKKRLESLGIKNINDFISLFCEIETKDSIKASGKMEAVDQVRKFGNLRQLQSLVREYIDFRTGDEVGIPRPTKIKLTPKLKMTELQAEYVKEAQDLFADKDAGTLVAITELQKITLSPYLSRYHLGGLSSVTPKELVENSPKIKYAVEGIVKAQKTQKNAGQIIFAEKGIEIFPLIKEYLIKEKGYKRGEVEIIDSKVGGDKKDLLQDKFQNGEIKVLLCSGTVKEGVDLQKLSTDLYNLHLQWNPTDMIQAEGRTWRQGSHFDNVRIHYPLVENSVDPFIFQKLEEKASRIADVFSYKGDNLDVSDIDFEGMKMDLITDPELRLQAEEKFKTASFVNKRDLLESEIAFLERRTKRIGEVKAELKSTQESYFYGNAEAKERKLNKLKAELEEEKFKLKKRGAQDDVAKELEEKKKSLEEIKKSIENLSEEFRTKKENISKEENIIYGDNNYAEIVEFMGDKEFYTFDGGKMAYLSEESLNTFLSSETAKGLMKEIYEELNPNIKACLSFELLREVRNKNGVLTLADFDGVKNLLRIGRNMDKETFKRVFRHELNHAAFSLMGAENQAKIIAWYKNLTPKEKIRIYGSEELFNSYLKDYRGDVKKMADETINMAMGREEQRHPIFKLIRSIVNAIVRALQHISINGKVFAKESAQKRASFVEVMDLYSDMYSQTGGEKYARTKEYLQSLKDNGFVEGSILDVEIQEKINESWRKRKVELNTFSVDYDRLIIDKDTVLALKDVKKGRLSYSNLPILVKLDTKTGKYIIVDGRHRMIQQFLNGERIFTATINEFNYRQASLVEEESNKIKVPEYTRKGKIVKTHSRRAVVKMIDMRKTGEATNKEKRRIYMEAFDKVYGEKKPPSVAKMVEEKFKDKQRRTLITAGKLEEVGFEVVKASFKEGKVVGFIKGENDALEKTEKEIEELAEKIKKAEYKTVAQRATFEARIEELKEKHAEQKKELYLKLDKQETSYKKQKARLREKLKEKMKDYKAIRKEMVEYVKDNLPRSRWGKFLIRIRDGKTNKNLAKIMEKVDEEVLNLQREIAIKNIKSILKKADQLPIEFQMMMKEITGEINWVGTLPKTMDKLKKIDEYIKTHPDARNQFSRGILKRLGILSQKSYKELTASQLLALNSRLELIRNIGRAVKYQRKVNKIIERNNILAEIQKNSTNFDKIQQSGLTQEEREKRTFWEKTIDKLQDVDWQIMPVDSFIKNLDKGIENGINYRTFKKPVDIAFNDYLKLSISMKDRLYDFIKTSGFEVSDKSWENIGIYAINNQRGGRIKLLKSGYSEEQIDAVELTEQEMAMYGYLRQELDKIYPLIKEVYEKVYNKPLGKVENYFPFIMDFSNQAPLFEEMEQQFNFGLKGTNKGFTEERVGGFNPIKVNALTAFVEHIDKATYFISLEETVKKAEDLVKSHKYAEAVGEKAQKYMMRWVELIQRHGTPKDNKDIRALDALRKNITLGVLAFKLTTIPIQLTAVLNGMAEIGTSALTGFIDVTSSKKKRDFIVAVSMQMRTTVGDDPIYGEIQPTAFKQKAQEVGMWAIKKVDLMARAGVWWGAYEMYLKNRGLEVDYNNPDQEAVLFADKIVRKTQATSDFKDLPPLLTQKYRTYGKLLLQFQNFGLFQFAYMRNDVKYNISNDIGKASWQIAMISLSVITVFSIREAISNALYGGDDEDEESFIAKYFWEMGQIVPVLGSMLYGVRGLIKNPNIYQALSVKTGIPVIDTAVMGLREAGMTAISKKPDTIAKHAIGVTSVAGQMSGIPGSLQTSQFANAILRRLKKEEAPQTREEILKKYKKENKIETRQQIINRYRKENGLE